MPQGNDLLEALIDKLGEVSPVWSRTFAGSPAVDVAGWKRTQLVIREYGESKVREAFEYCLATNVIPRGRSALPLMHAICGKGKP